ncbi:MAG: hypothetical protein AB1641_08430 [Thermodesulfobacteriota bacterium]
MMKCSEVEERLIDLLYEEPDSADEQVREHLSQCRNCSTKLDEYRRLRAMVTGRVEPEPSALVLNRIKAQAREEVGRAGPLWGWLKLAAAFCLMAVVGGLVAYQLRTGLVSTESTTVSPGVRTDELAPFRAEIRKTKTAAEPEVEPLGSAAPPTEPDSTGALAAKPAPEPTPALRGVKPPPAAAGEVKKDVGAGLAKPSAQPARTDQPKALPKSPAPAKPVLEAARPGEKKKPEVRAGLDDAAVTETKTIATGQDKDETPAPAAPPPLRGPKPEKRDKAAPAESVLPGQTSSFMPSSLPEVSLGRAQKIEPPASETSGPGRAGAGQPAEELDRAAAEKGRAEGEVQASLAAKLDEGRKALDSGQFARAAEVFQVVLRGLPPGHQDRPMVLLWLAKAHEGRGHNSQARAIYRTLAQESPAHADMAERKLRELEAK